MSMYAEQESTESYEPTVGYEAHTGDPRADLEYERQYSQYQVPDVVKKFLTYFHSIINDGHMYEIQNLYENTYPQLTDEYFKSSPWPEPEDIAHLVQEDEIFLILYRELYYRHVYARVQGGPTLEQRIDSYYNYCNFFNYILSSAHPVQLELPNQWLWEIIDEFIYQFQSFSQYQAKLEKKTKEELEMLRNLPKVWNVLSVLNVLHSLVDKSNINQQLVVYMNGGDAESVAGDFGRHSLYKMLGYFSLVGLLRLHSLLGDYYQAVKVLENIELNKKSTYSRVPGCQITTYYYVGFAYLMMRRYADAIRTFSDILLYIQRTKMMFQTKSYQNDQINKQTDQMYTLLAVCLVLYPQRIDESVHAALREKTYAEKMQRLQRGEVQEFEKCFMLACPKFLSPVPPSPDAPPVNYHKEPYQLQLKVFLDEVQQQVVLPTIRSYLKLYTTMPLAKLAAFMDVDTAQFHTYLLCFKHKMRNIVWTKGTSGIGGEFKAGSEVDFYVDKNMIHIADTKVARRYGDFFIRQIIKFEEMFRNLRALKL